ncbi:MAG TPA: DNA replication and repair protein RecF [Steroidobacteraceae bacterium]|nr:DNA replication and repair protein RecF [Steroidobacteraceae bacterium]
MSLIEVSVDHLRCLRHAELALAPGRNLIYGENGSGKTSLLEALYLLGRGRSFRTRNSEKLITHGERQLVVFGRLQSGLGEEHPHSAPLVSPAASVSGVQDGMGLVSAGSPLSAQKPGGVTSARALGLQVVRGEATVAKVDGRFVQSLAELSQALPVQVIEPGVHKLVEEGAFRRRRWLDWAVFHVEQGFMETWSHYARALRQRNSALRRDAAQVRAWEPELIRLGELLSDSRRRLIERLVPHWAPMALALTGLELELIYSQGWPRDQSLPEALEACRDRDALRGQTHAGPHRADVLIRRGGRLARESLSRGQQKLLAVSLILAQLVLLQELLPDAPLLLLDDPAAELDPSRLAVFIEQVARLDCQLVLTSLSPDMSSFGRPERVFHVEQGGVRQV